MKIEILIDDGAFTPARGIPNQLSRYQQRIAQLRALTERDHDELIIETLGNIAREVPRAVIAIVWHSSPLYDFKVYSLKTEQLTSWSDLEVERYPPPRPHVFSVKRRRGFDTEFVI